MLTHDRSRVQRAQHVDGWCLSLSASPSQITKKKTVAGALQGPLASCVCVCVCVCGWVGVCVGGWVCVWVGGCVTDRERQRERRTHPGQKIASGAVAPAAGVI